MLITLKGYKWEVEGENSTQAQGEGGHLTVRKTLSAPRPQAVLTSKVLLISVNQNHTAISTGKKIQHPSYRLWKPVVLKVSSLPQSHSEMGIRV